MQARRSNRVHVRCLALVCAAVLAAGCASTPEKAKATSDRYGRELTYPDRLKPIGGDSTARIWIDPAVDYRQYSQIMIERIRVQLDADSPAIDPADLKALTDYFHQALDKALQPQYPMATKPGASVLRMRITLVDLVATKPEVSVIVLVTPYATIPDMVVSAAAGGPTGSAPYLGRTGIAVEFIDGGNDNVVAQFVDTNFGRKFVLDSDDAAKNMSQSVDSYMKSFSTWAYAQQAFDQWSQQFRRILDTASARRSAS